MIYTTEEYERTVKYIDGLQRILVQMRETHRPEQYNHMSRSYLKELAKAQREVTLFFAVPAQTNSGPKEGVSERLP